MLTERQIKNLLNQVGDEWNGLEDKRTRGEYINDIDEHVLRSYKEALQIILKLARPEIYLSYRVLHLDTDSEHDESGKHEVSNPQQEPGVDY